LRQFLSISESSSERHGVQAQQYQLLQVIAAAPAAQPASVSYLADRMVLRHNSTVELVDRAERAGLVRRHTDERDLRRSIIKLTPAGEQLLRSMVTEHVQELERIGEKIVQALRTVVPGANGAESAAPGHPNAGAPSSVEMDDTRHGLHRP
jgi:DNA-binding MarR family transcriptional regulator